MSRGATNSSPGSQGGFHPSGRTEFVQPNVDGLARKLSGNPSKNGGSGSGFTQVSQRVVHEGAVVTFTVGTFRSPSGELLERDVVKHPGAVSVVAIDGEEVVLVRQFRAALGFDLLEIPAGKRDVPGEAPEVTAARELEEEVGLRAGSLELLVDFYNSAGFSDEHSYVYLATDLHAGELALQGVEEQHMTIVRIPLEEIPARIAAGEIIDAKTLIGLLLALRRFGV